MKTVNKNSPPSETELNAFLTNIYFKLPTGFIEFFKECDGADIVGEDSYVALWPVTEMLQLNIDYDVEEYASSYFIFGSDGGDMAYAIKKETGDIYEMPFIGMGDGEAVFKGSDFAEFIDCF